MLKRTRKQKYTMLTNNLKIITFLSVMYKYLYMLLSVNAKKDVFISLFLWIIYILKIYILEYDDKENAQMVPCSVPILKLINYLHPFILK